MRQSLRLGKVAGIPVGVHWSVVVIVGLIAGLLGAQVLPAMAPGEPAVGYWLAAVPGALLFVAALLAHELAHAFVARHYRIEVKSITLWALGGVAELRDEAPSARADLLIAVSGPATSLAAGAVFAGATLAVNAAGGPAIAVAGLYWLAVMNGLLAVFNLLPGAPLDGGRILRAILWMRHGDQSRAARTAAMAGRVIGGGLIGLGIAEFIVWRDAGGLWLALIGLFLISAASSELTTRVATDALAGLRVWEVMIPHPSTGAGWISVSDFVEHVARYSQQNVFPVVSFDGALTGVVDLEMIGRVPAQARVITPLRQIAARVPPAYLAGPQDPAASLLNRLPLGGRLTAVVLEEGRIVGLVTTDRLRQVIDRERLRQRPLHETRAG